jgi:hypothetical protein
VDGTLLFQKLILVMTFFVVRDENGEFVRVQVKTATGIKRQKGISAQFSLPISQLIREYVPELSYCFMVW